MQAEIIGILHRIDPIETFGESFKTRYIYLKHIDENNRTQFIKFRLSHRRVELLDGFEINQKVKLTFSLEGREVKNANNELAIYDSKEVSVIEGCNEDVVKTSEEKNKESQTDWENQQDIELWF